MDIEEAIYHIKRLKKGIETLNMFLLNDENSKDIVDIKAIETILSAYEKQQKEIEELKEKEKNLLLEVTKNIISKDKIKLKIEEIKKQIEKYKGKKFLPIWEDAQISILQELLEKE